MTDVILALTAAWHAAAFGAGGFFVYFSYLALFGKAAYEPRWGRVIRQADVHLWLSGLVLIAVGMKIAGADVYFTNPKLWAKATVIVAWLVSTQYMRRIALPLFRTGSRRAMLMCSSVNVSCWVYGAFLGCAKSLAYGKASYPEFVAGFAFVMALSAATTGYLERCYKKTGVISAI